MISCIMVTHHHVCLRSFMHAVYKQDVKMDASKGHLHTKIYAPEKVAKSFTHLSLRYHIPTQKFKLIGGRPKQVYEAISNPLIGRCEMWDFPTLPLTCRPNKSHERACHVCYIRTTRLEPTRIPCKISYTNPKA